MKKQSKSSFVGEVRLRIMSELMWRNILIVEGILQGPLRELLEDFARETRLEIAILLRRLLTLGAERLRMCKLSLPPDLGNSGSTEIAIGE